MHKDRLTLASMCGGALQEKLDRALRTVADNIVDPNTDPGKVRAITVKLKLKPNPDDVEDVEVSADVSMTLAPESGVKTHLFINKDMRSGKVKIQEHQRGEIKGQLDFSDLEDYEGPEEDEEEVAEEATEVIDFRRTAEG